MRWLALALFGLSTVAAAEDWATFATTSDGDVHAYARDKLHFEGNGVALWRKVEFRMPLPVRSGLAQSAWYREHIECAKLQLRTLGYLYYAADGSVIDNVYAPDAPPVPIYKDTPAEQLAATLCPMAAERAAEAEAPVDELEKLRREVEALQRQVRTLRQGVEVQRADGTGR